jgi:hypothetical protein
MTTRTRRDLVVAALATLGILAAGQQPDAEDFEAVDDHFEPLIAWLEAAQIIDLDNTIDAIPNEWFSPLTTLLADDAALEFGLPGVPAAPNSPSPVAAAIDQLRLAIYARPTYEVQKSEYY